MNHCELVIIGGGVVGLTAALAMAHCQLKVALVDAGPLKINDEQPDLRVYAINKASQALLDELGVSLNEKRISPYQKMHVWDALNKAFIDFDSRMIASSSLGAIIEESVLKSALLKQVHLSPNISLFPHSKVIRIQSLEQGIEVASEEQSWQANLLLVADGASSPTRQLLDVSLTSWSYKQQAIIATVQTQKEHQQTAYQVFHPNGPLAFLPLKDPHQCSIVWSTELSHAKELMALNEEEFNQALSLAFEHQLGECTLLSTRHQFPLTMRHAQEYVGKNWLLLGDAAHTIHPLAGLGLNIGLADVAAWYRQIKNNKKALHSTKALKAYQRERKNAVWQTILLMEGFKQLFSFPSTPLRFLRGLGLNFCNQLTPLKRLFIHHAAGDK